MVITHVMEHICFKQDIEKIDLNSKETIVSFMAIASILFTGNLDLFSYIKKLDGFSAELFLSLPKQLLVNGQRGISLLAK